MAQAFMNIKNPEHERSHDPQLAEDTRMLLLALTTNYYPNTIDQQLRDLPDEPYEQFQALMQLAKDVESHLIFGGALFEAATQHQELLEAKHIFALPRHPQWMGASTYLPSLRGASLTVFESHTYRGRPGMFMAMPATHPHPLDNDTTFPEGEPELLRDIALWHGAASCHWVPRDNGNDDENENEEKPSPEMLPSLTLV